MLLRLMARFIISIVPMKNGLFYYRMGYNPICLFLARHHWHNANQKRAVLIKWAKICYV